MKKIIADANEAVARASVKLSEISFVYPITPSSPMAENCDKFVAQGQSNIFGTKMNITEMQSEAGAIGALHGSALSGKVSTTFTSSQGLLLMIPNMYKIAGERLPVVINVASRSVATHALNIFCDHSDVMATRQTGFAMLASSNPQEAYDFAVASFLTSQRAKIPFLHFFDGFRTSHQISNINIFDDEELKKIYPFESLQSGDIFFQGQERQNNDYKNLPKILQSTFDDLAKLGAKQHFTMEYFGSARAKFVIAVMASAFDTVKNFVDYAKDDELGIVKINLYRPFGADQFDKILPKSVQKIAVLDRTKEQGSFGEPLYLDICASVLDKGRNIRVFGGRYGLGGKEFSPQMAKAVFDNLKSASTKNHFCVGIDDDLSNLSLPIDENFEIGDDTFDILLCGLGSDGTVSASKNITKIVAEKTNCFVNAYFAYDSKKSGGLTRSYLNFAKEKFEKPYIQQKNNVVVVNNESFLQKYNFAKLLKQNGIFLMNAKFKGTGDLNDFLPNNLKIELAKKNAKVFSVDATNIASKNGIAGKISGIMQVALFAVTNMMNFDDALKSTKEMMQKVYAKKGQDVVQRNLNALDDVLANLAQIDVDMSWLNLKQEQKPLTNNKYVDEYVNKILDLNGDMLPVSKVNECGKNQVGTTCFEKRNIANVLPKWISEKCIECGKCSFVCPHAVIRAKLATEKNLKNAPSTFVTKPCNFSKENRFLIEISPEDCTGCTLCSKVCPKKAIEIVPKEQIFEAEKQNFEFSKQIESQIPALPQSVLKTQFLKPYFEYSGACAGCGETPYIRLLTQLFGNHLVIANATGCSSIYGGSAPTCPYTKDKNGQGVAWANSLFEDNAEFCFGILKAKKLARENLKNFVRENLNRFDDELKYIVSTWLENFDNAQICDQTYFELKQKSNLKSNQNKVLFDNLDAITKSAVWAIGGDGWAYDIDFGGIDHVLASGENIKILVLDTEVYSNTGGQMSKSTPRNAIASFANNGKKTAKKRLPLFAMAHKNVYVAQVCLGADMNQTLKAFEEAQNFDGPSLILAYAPCINHGIKMTDNIQTQIDAVNCGYWPLFRFNPALKTPLVLDSKITTNFDEYLLKERRFANFAEKFGANDFEKTKEDSIEFFELLQKLSKALNKN